MSLINHLSATDYCLLHAQDITSLDEAKTYIDMLARNGLMYHFDDGPENIIWCLPDNCQPTPADIQAMWQRQHQFTSDDNLEPFDWSKDGGCPIGYAMLCLREHGDIPENAF